MQPENKSNHKSKNIEKSNRKLQTEKQKQS